MSLVLGKKVIVNPDNSIIAEVRRKNRERMLKEKHNQILIKILLRHQNEHPNYISFDPDICYKFNRHRNLQDAINNGEIYSKRQMENMGTIDKVSFTAEQWLSDISQVTITNPRKPITHMILVFIGNRCTADHLLDLLSTSPLLDVGPLLDVEPLLDVGPLDVGPFIGIAVKGNDLYQCYKEKIDKIASAVFISEEFGTDIIPTLQMYYVLRQKYNIGNIPVIKLHTKSKLLWYILTTNYLLQRTWNQLAQIYSISGENTITDPDYMYTMSQDRDFCPQYKTKYQAYLDNTRKFCAGSIFYTVSSTFDKVISFMVNNNYRAYFTNNMYICNSVIRDSPIHFIERLFGLIRI